MSSLLQDLRLALRQLRRARGLTAVVVAVLAIGIGANTALVTIIDAIVKRPPPGVRDARDLVRLSLRREDPVGRGLTWEQFLRFQDRRDLFTAVAVARPVTVALQTADATETRPAVLASSEYFAVLRPRLVLGTGLPRGDDRSSDAPRHAVIGHGLWMRAFAGRDDVIGESIGVNGQTFTIVGVAPSRFVGDEITEDWPDVWVPAALRAHLFPPDSPLGNAQNWRSWPAIARLAPGISSERARAATGLLAAQFEEELAQRGTRTRLRAQITPLAAEAGDPRDVYTSVGLLGGALSGLLLLVACANASSLLLARGVARRREIAVKLAMGATRWRLARQLLVESVLVALLAGLVGGLLVASLARWFESTFPFPLDLTPNPGTAAITIAIAAVAGIAFGMMPALHATRTSVFDALRTGGPAMDPARARLQRTFAVAQLTLGLPVLTTAALFSTGLREATGRNAGFDASGDALGVTMSFSLLDYPSARVEALVEAARERVAAIPGVRVVAITGRAPFFDGFGTRALSLPPDDPGGGATIRAGIDGQIVSIPRRFEAIPVDAGFFRTLGIPLRRGRGIEASDVPGAPLVAVVSEDFAHRTWPGLDPIGRTLRAGRNRDSVVTIVGLVGAVRRSAVSSGTDPVVYLSWRQLPSLTTATLVVRTAGDAAPLIPVVQRELHRLDPQLPLRNLATFESQRSADLREVRPVILVAYLGAALALALACLGVYALLAFTVAQRAREIAIRMALGARSSQVGGLIVRQGVRLALVSLVIGLPLALAARLAVQETLGDVEIVTRNVLAVGGVAGLLVLTAAAASWLPARRAAAVDPFSQLREE